MLKSIVDADFQLMIKRRIESLAILRGFRLEDVANAIGMNYATFRCKLVGKSEWKASEIFKLSEYLSVTADYLLKGD